MSDGVVVAIISSITAVVLALVNAIIAAFQRRAQKKNSVHESVEEVKSELKEVKSEIRELRDDNRLQYLSLLRLTVMDSDMPMSERLIAGKEYLAKGGNGDVKAFYEELEHKVNG